MLHHKIVLNKSGFLDFLGFKTKKDQTFQRTMEKLLYFKTKMNTNSNRIGYYKEISMDASIASPY
jgi:hypothetical protein